MTNKIYRSAMGVPVDMGALSLQNETVRAVGNMSVNARGDVLNSQNQIVESRSQQVKRQYSRQSAGPSRTTPYASVVEARRARQAQSETFAEPADTFNDLPEDNDVVAEAVVQEPKQAVQTSGGGLAGAIARSREVRQEREQTLRERQQSTGVKKI